MGRHDRVVGRTVVAVERQIGELPRNRVAAGATESDVERIGANDLEMQVAPVFRQQIEGATIGPGDSLGRDRDLLQQAVEVTLVG